MAAEHRPSSLLVFSDDWGRHPSSCQHLIRQLLPRYKVLWVNTIGTRTPKPNLATFRRAAEKIGLWAGRHQGTPGAGTDEEQPRSHPNLQVACPRMWPWFTRGFDRRLNIRALRRQLMPMIESLPKPVRAVTTLPITADLPGRLPVDEWIYYCVDDFAEWPGLDGRTLQKMDVEMIHRADRLVAVSEHLQDMIANHGRQSELLTHGVDVEFWTSGAAAEAEVLAQGPVVMFWGVVDRRLDTGMLKRLAEKLQGSIVLVGPMQDPDPNLLALPNLHTLGPRKLTQLPALAQRADVLVMPYADLPVTRAMQPLKMKEYMATGRPVVVSHLPAVHDWRDCIDVVSIPTDFVLTVLERINSGVPKQQQHARKRLADESWERKAAEFDNSLCGFDQEERATPEACKS